MTRPLSRMRSTTSARPVGCGVRITPPPLRAATAVVAIPIPPYFERLPEVAFAREPPLLRRPLPDDERDFDVDLEVDFEVELHARQALAELVEGDDADVRHAADRAPDDPLVGALLDDLRLPHAADAPDLPVEDDAIVVALLDALDAVHELREVLEL